MVVFFTLLGNISKTKVLFLMIVSPMSQALEASPNAPKPAMMVQTD